MSYLIKKITALCLAALFLVGTCLFFTACRQNDPQINEEQNSQNNPQHTHSYTAQQIAATCQERAHTQYTCECGDSYSDNFSGDLAPHVGQGTCRTCKINYFNALANFIKEEGQYEEERYVVDILQSTYETSAYVILAIFSPESNSINISCGIASSLTNNTDILLLDMENASGYYDWIYTSSSSSQTRIMTGQLNATSLTTSTQTIPVTANTFPSYLQDISVKLATSALHLCVSGLDLLLIKDGSGMSVANFGFDNY